MPPNLNLYHHSNPSHPTPHPLILSLPLPLQHMLASFFFYPLLQPCLFHKHLQRKVEGQVSPHKTSIKTFTSDRVSTRFDSSTIIRTTGSGSAKYLTNERNAMGIPLTIVVTVAAGTTIGGGGVSASPAGDLGVLALETTLTGLAGVAAPSTGTDGRGTSCGAFGTPGWRVRKLEHFFRKLSILTVFSNLKGARHCIHHAHDCAVWGLLFGVCFLVRYVNRDWF